MAGLRRPLVLTSGNLSDDPIAHTDDDAIARLGPLVDGMLTHDRPIHIRCDDSVVRARGGRTQVLRRSRGFAPEPMALPFAARTQVLAVGAELKNTVSVAQGRHALRQPSHRRSRAPGHLPVVPPGRRPPVPALRGGRPMWSPTTCTRSTCPPRWPSSSTCRPSASSTTTPTSPRAWSSTAARTRARRRLRRPRLRHRRDLLGRRVPRRRSRRLRAGRSSPAVASARRDGRHP